MCVCVCVRMCVRTCCVSVGAQVSCGLHVEVRDQLCGIAPLSTFTWILGLSGSQANTYLLSLLPTHVTVI